MRTFLRCCFAWSLACSFAQATIFYYDTNVAAGLGGTPPVGSWASGVNAQWTTDPLGATAPTTASWADGTNNDAVFDGTPASITVTASPGVFPQSLTFKTNGYTITGGLLTLRGTAQFVVDPGVTANFNSTLAGTAGYNVSGGGTINLQNASSGITGPVSVTGGSTLAIATSAQIGGTGVGAGNITLDGGTFRNIVSSGTPTMVTGNRGFVIGANGGTIDVPGTAIQIYTSGSITGVGNTLTKSGTGTLRNTTPTSITFSKLVVTGGLYQAAADNIFGAVPGSPLADAITLNGGGISSNAGFSFSANRGITLLAGGGTINASSSPTVLGVISGVGSLTKTGANILTLSGNNTYQGGTFLNVGRINFNHNNAAGTGAITAANATGIEIVSTAAGITLANNVTLLGSGANAAKMYATSGNSLKLTGQISGAGGVLRDDSGAGTLTLAGDNSFAGGVRITSRGFVLGHKNALGTGTFTVGDTAAAPATAIALSAETDLSGSSAVGNAVTINRDVTVAGTNNLEFSGPVTLATSSPAIHTTNSGVTTFSGSIGGAGFGLTKTGTGRLVLSGANAYTGPTIINSGTVYANNTIGSATGAGNLTVNNGGTLSGTGAVSGTVSVAAGGLLAPGGSIESLSTGAVSFAASATLAVELDTSVALSVAADLLNSSGGLTIDPAALLTLTDVAMTPGAFPIGAKFSLVRYAAGMWNGGTFAGYADDSTFFFGSNWLHINYNDVAAGVNFGGGDAGGEYLTLTVAAVPEASSLLFLAAATTVAGGLAWRRKSWPSSRRLEDGR